MPYGTIKIDTVTFTDAGVDKSVTLSGLVQNPTFSGNVTVTGTLSGVTVTGTTANFTSGNFTNISGGTHTITSGVFAAGSAASPSITFTGDLNTGIYSPGADQVAISTNGSGRLFVDASGGISTSSTAWQGGAAYQAGGLQIGGSTYAKAILQTNGTIRSEWFFDNADTYLQAKTGIFYITNTTANPIGFYTNGSERLRITSAGLVGIGTTTVDVKTQIVKNALTKSWSADGDDVLAIENSGTTNVDFRSGSSSSTYLMFSDGDARARGYVAYLHSSDALLLGAANSERARIDSSGRLLVGTSSARNNDLFSASQFQVEGTDAATSSISLTRNVAAVGAGGIALCKSRSSSIGGVTVVQSGDVLGFIDFQGADGTDFARAATIAAEVDGTPGNNDMPGRLVFSTTADGASSPTERMRLNNLGYLTGTVNGLGNGLYLANQFYRLNSGNVGSNATGAQSVFGVGVNLIADTVYAFESFYVLQKSAGTTSHTIAVSFGGTAGLNNISYGIIWNRDNTTAASSNMSGIAGAYQSFATSASSLVLTSAIASSGQTVTLKLSGTVSISTAGTFIPQYTLSAAPGGAYTTLAGSYFKIAALGASGANTSIGSWA